MAIAFDINGGNCAECGAKQSLEIRVVVEGDVIWGDVSCIKCHAWITDLMRDEMEHYGIQVDKNYLGKPQDWII